jgi:hypothetical protein
MEILNDIKKYRFWRHYMTRSLATGGAISGTMQFITIIYPEIKLFQGWIPLTIVVVFSLIIGLILSWPNPIAQSYSSPNTKISIVKGNILEQTTHLVIGTCDTFDTAIPNIIARQSLQGQALDVLFGGDLERMDRLLDDSLQTKAVIGSITKPGKTKKYGVGAIATIPDGARKLFFLAYTQMNHRNEASATADDIWKSLQALWDEMSAAANGGPVSIPVIGGGQARLSSILPAQDSIRFIALSFMMASRRARFCNELRVVVRPEDYERLDRLEIQSFLSSLRAS